MIPQFTYLFLLLGVVLIWAFSILGINNLRCNMWRCTGWELFDTDQRVGRVRQGSRSQKDRFTLIFAPGSLDQKKGTEAEQEGEIRKWGQGPKEGADLVRKGGLAGLGEPGQEMDSFHILNLLLLLSLQVTQKWKENISGSASSPVWTTGSMSVSSQAWTFRMHTRSPPMHIYRVAPDQQATQLPWRKRPWPCVHLAPAVHSSPGTGNLRTLAWRTPYCRVSPYCHWLHKLACHHSYSWSHLQFLTSPSLTAMPVNSIST